MSQYGMVIDLKKCVGCGACALGCKTENNTGDRAGGQTFNWADFMVHEEGKFPKMKATMMPVLCNHCSKAKCVEACPVEPKAMFKTADGITMHNAERCVGCQSCQEECPYSSLDVDKDGAQHSVISFNENGIGSYRRYEDIESVMEGCTSSGAEIGRLTQQVPPHRTMFKHPDYGSTRRPDVTEKCTFCAHRLADGKLPACVVVCPAEARIFGDLSEPGSDVAKAIAKQEPFRLKEKEGTQPNVYYIGSYNGKKNS